MSNLADPQEPIAIVGMGCRFPGGANRPSKLWDLLLSKPDLTRKPPPSRFNIDGFYNTNGEYHGATNAPSSYFLDEDITQFDNQFFNITPKEAEAMDPQQRILLETVYEAMEGAGLSIKDMEGSQTAVYVGLMCLDWCDLQFRDLNMAPQYTGTGASRAIISNRVSYFYDWRGPSMTIDTACSSSLVAMHEAVRSLRSGETNFACAAGANLLLGPEYYIVLSNLHMLSPTGRSRMWDASADGYARGEAVAAVMMKRLSDAIRDGDHIEAIIRETGVNSDGRTKGITMPSNISQANLVRDTYRRAGLDVNKPSDRPQYFEAHGTGTQAGDLQEATAISSSFFSTEKDDVEQKLVVGSIKTIVGHTEGTAGLAGVIKAILSMQNGMIPPNNHLERLNPALEPFMKFLTVPTKATTWPSTAAGVARRASVNSFGFGGTNAHAILEAFEPAIHSSLVKTSQKPSTPLRTSSKLPLLFSAASDKALLESVQQYAEYIRNNPKVDLHSLAWTLQARRSAMQYKISISNTDREAILQQMDDICKDAEGLGVRTKLVSGDTNARLLGVFTGQGAQWATMGSKLIQNSLLFRQRFESLEQSLASLPDPPTWSLKAELLAPPGSSRVGEAIISQPICTAVQVALIDLLKATGVHFRAVVGHSSGEIAAAYAAGYLTAEDAIRIAYYRGFYAHLAKAKDGSRGLMMATGLNRQAAIEFCGQDRFRGRVVVAASNSPTSVTLSGDADGIKEAQKDLSATGTFARLLQVDTAYHSHHMLATAEPYVAALKACGVAPLRPARKGVWFSSAQAHHRDPKVDELVGAYWRDNMVGTVLFTEALTAAAETAGPFDACLEIGPHPALKGPATQTLKEASPETGAYFGVLDRKKDDTVAFSDALAGLWMHTGAGTINFDGLLSSLDQGTSPHEMLLDTPSYSWQHEQSHWRESRWSKRYRSRDTPHELLGSRLPTDSDQDLRWHNLLKADEVPWLMDHRFKGQIIVPAAAYCAIALEAARVYGQDQEIETIELRQLDLASAITMKENSLGVEVLSSLRPHVQSSGNMLMADFSCSAGPPDGSLPFKKICSATLAIRLGNSSGNCLPPRDRNRPTLHPFDVDRFYQMMSGTGLEYTGSFRGLRSAERRLDTASAVVGTPAEPNEAYFLHPTTLDVCFQTLFAAYSAPGDGAIWTSFLPRGIRNLTVSVADSKASIEAKTNVVVDARVTDLHYPRETRGASIVGDIEIFSERVNHTLIQVEGIELLSFDAGNEQSDRELLTYETWQPDVTEHVDVPVPRTCDPTTRELIDACRRVASFYFKELLRKVPAEHYTPGYAKLSAVASQWVSSSLRDHPSWEADTEVEIDGLITRYDQCVDIALSRAVGERLPTIVRGNLKPLEDETISALYNQLSTRGFCAKATHEKFSQLVKQIAHKYSNLQVLEIGAVTGDATFKVLEGLGKTFSRYVVTSCSDDMTERVQADLKNVSPKISIQTLDPKVAIEEQGLSSNSFDLVVITDPFIDIEASLPQIRSLMRPGGYLLMESLSEKNIRNSLFKVAATFVDSAPQEDEAETAPKSQPTFGSSTPLKLDTALKKAEFSGIDAISYDHDDEFYRVSSVLLTQAVDSRINYFRRPSPAMKMSGMVNSLLIVGGATLETYQFNEALTQLLAGWAKKVIRVDSFADLTPKMVKKANVMLCLEDIDEPFLRSFTDDSWEKMKSAVQSMSAVLWLLRGARDDNPYHSGTIGMGRTIATENPQTYFQFLDLQKLEGSEKLVMQSILRLTFAQAINSKLDKTLLWKVEQELVVDGGKIVVPRLHPLQDANQRLNTFRNITTELIDLRKHGRHLDIKDDTVSVVPSSPGSLLQAVNQPDNLHLETSLTTSKPVELNGSSVFLGIAADMKSGQRYLVALEQIEARPIIAATQAAVIDSTANDIACLQQAFAIVVAQKIATIAPTTGTTLIQESGSFANTIQEAFTSTSKKVAFISRDNDADVSSSTVDGAYVHPMATRRTVLNAIPIDTTFFVDLSPASTRCTYDVRDLVAPTRGSVGLETIFSHMSAFTTSIHTPHSVKEGLVHLCSMVRTPKADFASLTKPYNQVAVSALLSAKSPPSVSTFVDWTSDLELSVRTSPLDLSTLFAADKTYLMVGLTGELGLSICRWMVQQGARDIVLSSRSAKVDARWKQEMTAMGATIRLERCDVTDKSQVIGLKSRIHNNPYPIAGVFNGAMVMEDVPFENMKANTMRKVLRPKVEGTRFLDEVFWDDPLDFFIVTSSTSAVVGSPGQANYASGNQYMTGVAYNRRKRGVVGTAASFGLIAGVGFIRTSNNESSIEYHIRRQNVAPICEADVHAVLAEAIIAGRPGPEGYSELITCLEKANLSDPNQHPHWLNNPRFSHLLYDSSAAVGSSEAASGSDSKSGLSSATSEKQVVEVIQEAFAAQLAVILQIAGGSVKTNLPLVDLGIDSLVAVEIRSWILNFTGQDVPVLTILGGASVTDICEEIAPAVFEAKGSVEVNADVPATAAVDAPPSVPASILKGESSKDNVGGSITPRTITWSAQVSSDDESDSDDSDGESTPSESSRMSPDTDVDSRFARTPAVSKGPMPPWQSIEPLSYGQSRIWFPSQYTDDPSTYNCTTSYRLRGDLDVENLRKAIWDVTQRHESLRTAFHTDSFTGEGMQDILFLSPFDLKVINPANDSTDVDVEFKRLAAHSFDLEAGSTFAATVLVHSPDYATVIFGYHHLVMDGVSWQLTLQDIERHYKPHAKIPAPSQYPAFARKQRDLIQRGQFDKSRAFWKSELTSPPEPLPLFPFAKVSEREAVSRYDTVDLVQPIEPNLMAKIKQASINVKTTTFHVHLATIQVLLRQYLRVKDFCLGIIDANRIDSEHMQTIGFMLNLLPVRFKLEDDQAFSEVVKATRGKIYGALGQSAIPYEIMLEDVNAPRKSGTPPLFQVMVNYRMGALKQKTIGDLGLEFLDYADARNPYDISFAIDEKDDGTGGYISLSLPEYMFTKESGQLIMDAYFNLLETFVSDTNLSIDTPSLYSSTQIESAVALGTGEKLVSTWPDTLSKRIQQLAQAEPDSIAVTDSTNKSITYSQLMVRANALAAVIEPHVSKNARIGVLCEPTLDLICTLIAIMRLGATYIPLDSSLPDPRLKLITDEARPSIVIYDNATGDRVRNVAGSSAEVFNMSSLPSRAAKVLEDKSKPDGVAFILFTSGSTGRPKGVKLTHQNYVHHVAAASKFLRLEKEVVLQQSSVGFDLSLAQIFYALANGGTVVVAGSRRDPAHLTELMAKHKVTFTFCVPSEYSLMLSYNLNTLKSCDSWRIALSSGESFPISLKSKFRALDRPVFRLVNGYGPTEASVNASMGDVAIWDKNDSEKVSIGKTLDNYSVYIIDKSGQPLPALTSGEMVLAGPAISPGYLNMETMTAERFTPDNISAESVRSQGWNTLYHTGDKAMMGLDGQFVYQGRIEGDSQVKLNGVRVELEDIENTISNHANGAFSEVAVVLKGDTTKFAVAFTTVAPGKGNAPAVASSEEFLASLPLPSYMKPARVHTLAQMPLSASGKLDRNALKAIELSDLTESKPLTNGTAFSEIEVQLKDIWTTLLSGTGQSININKESDFFTLGGTSLLLLRLQAEIKEKMGNDLRLPELFKLTKFDALAGRLTAKVAPSTSSIINWDEETKVGQETLSAKSGRSTRKPKIGRSIVALTGATGFLGNALLQTLVNDPTIEKIHCLAIRSKPQSERPALLSNPKVVLHPGDLSMPNLGMTNGDIEATFGEVDAIVHNGADVSFMKDYQTLRQSNVGSTKELLKLAPGIPFHFVSTAGVALLSGQETFPEQTISSTPPPADGLNGYVSSKWASERFLERAAQVSVPSSVHIHRPSTITGNGTPSLDIVNNLLAFSRQLRAVPDLSAWPGAFDLVSVENVAGSILSSLKSSLQGDNPDSAVQYIHHCGEDVVRPGALDDFVARTSQGTREVEVLPGEEWIRRACDAGMNELVASYMQGATGGDAALAPTSTRLVKS